MFWSGAEIVWRRQVVLWWVFLANIVFAVLGTFGMDMRVARTLDHSLSAQRLAAKLVQGFVKGPLWVLRNFSIFPRARRKIAAISSALALRTVKTNARTPWAINASSSRGW